MKLYAAQLCNTYFISSDVVFIYATTVNARSMINQSCTLHFLNKQIYYFKQLKILKNILALMIC